MANHPRRNNRTETPSTGRSWDRVLAVSRRTDRQTRLIASVVVALAATACFIDSAAVTSRLARDLRSLGRILSLACDPPPYVTKAQAHEMPSTPLPPLPTEGDDGFEYIPTHVKMCQELKFRHDLSHADREENPGAVAHNFPPLTIKENEEVCMNWEAPHFHMMEMLASTFLSVYGKKYNLAYQHDCSRTRAEGHASDVEIATSRNLAESGEHSLDRARLPYDMTTVQQILADPSRILEHAIVMEEAEEEVLRLCQGCIAEHRMKRQQLDMSVEEENEKLSHVTHECLLYPGGKTGKAATSEGGAGIALSALRPIVVTLLRHAALDWKDRAMGPKEDKSTGAVVYVDAESSPMPTRVYAKHIPQNIKTIDVLVSPLCAKHVSCDKKTEELAEFLRELYPRAEIKREIVSSTAAAFSRMILTKHLVAGPGTVAALLPALSKPSGTYGIIGENEGAGQNTAGWFGGVDDGSKVALNWCVTPSCEDIEEDGKSKVGMSWPLPGEKDDKAKVGLSWGGVEGTEGAGEKDDESKVGLQWSLDGEHPGSGSTVGTPLNMEVVELDDEEILKAEEEGFLLTEEDLEYIEESWGRPVELRPDDQWKPPPKDIAAEAPGPGAPALPDPEPKPYSPPESKPIVLSEPDPEPYSPSKPENMPPDMSLTHTGDVPQPPQVPPAQNYNPPLEPQPQVPPQPQQPSQPVGGAPVGDVGYRPPQVTTGYRPPQVVTGHTPQQVASGYGPPQVVTGYRPPQVVAGPSYVSGPVSAPALGKPLLGCTHVRGKLGQWLPDGSWKEMTYPECDMSMMNLDGMCNVAHSLGLQRIMMVGDQLQGRMVQSMHNLLGLGDVDPNTLKTADGVWRKFIQCIDGHTFELAFARNDQPQFASFTPTMAVPPPLVGCPVCAPWVNYYQAYPVRTYVVACPCAHCIPAGPGGRRILGEIMSSLRGNHEEEQHTRRVQQFDSDLQAFLETARQVLQPEDAVFIRTAAPTYCQGAPIPDDEDLNWFNQRIHQAVYDFEWSSQKQGRSAPPVRVLDVAPMTSAHPARAAVALKGEEGQLDCDAGEGQAGRGPADWWNHMLYTHMVDVAKMENPAFQSGGQSP